MNNLRTLAVSVLAFAFTIQAIPAFAGMYDTELTAAQQRAVQNGEQVFQEKAVAGSDWPQAIIYQRIDGTPEEAAAVFHDANRHQEWMKGIKKSRISQQINRTEMQIDVTMKLQFPLSDENYSIRSKTSSYEAGAAYQLAWNQVRADSFKQFDGTIRFEKLGNATLMGYVNFIKPGRSGSGSLKGKAMERVREVATSIKDRVETIRVSNRALLDQEIAALRGALE